MEMTIAVLLIIALAIGMVTGSMKAAGWTLLLVPAFVGAFLVGVDLYQDGEIDGIDTNNGTIFYEEAYEDRREFISRLESQGYADRQIACLFDLRKIEKPRYLQRYTCPSR